MTSRNHGGYHYTTARARARKELFAYRIKVILGTACACGLAIILTIAIFGISRETMEPQAADNVTSNTTESLDTQNSDDELVAKYMKLLEENEELREAENENPAIQSTRISGIEITGYDSNIDYQNLINNLYSILGDLDEDTQNAILGLLEVLELQRNMKIESEDLGTTYQTSSTFHVDNSMSDIQAIMEPIETYYEYDAEDLRQLACIVYAEAGADWCTDEHQRDVASVVMNRVTDSRFPDTIYEVLHAPGQYPNTCNNTEYDARALENALYVLENGPTVEGAVWQAEFIQGTEIVRVHAYPGHSTTYICR